MRLLHTADLHLGKVIYDFSLLPDQKVVLDQIFQELLHGNYDVLVVAGDIFDRSVPPPEALVVWDDFLVNLRNNLPELPVIVISGNHDSAVRLSFATRFLAGRNIHIRTALEDADKPIRLSIDGRPWDFFAVPFLQAGSLRTDESVPLRSQRDLWQVTLERLHRARDPQVNSVMIGHLFAAGGSETDSERLFLGEAEQIPVEWFDGWTYVALGHLHRMQECAPGVVYSGSPLAYSFSEAGQKKVILRVDLGDGPCKIAPIELKPLRSMTRLSGSYEDFQTNPMVEIYRDHYLELELTDPALVAHPVERLRTRFPYLLSLVQKAYIAEPSEVIEAGRQTGNLELDTLSFLDFVGQPLEETSRKLLTSWVREVLHETS